MTRSAAVATYPPVLLLLRQIAEATPCPCEGSRGHLRSDFAWDLEQDWIDVASGDLSTFEDDLSADDCRRAIVRDALSAITRWFAEGGFDENEVAATERAA